MRVINEAATYKLAFRSNKPEADVFTNWVASEVLPSIRKTGKYETTPQQPALPVAASGSNDLRIRAKAEEMKRLMWKAGAASRDLRAAMVEMYVRPGLAASYIADKLYEETEKAFRDIDDLADTIALNMLALRKLVMV